MPGTGTGKNVFRKRPCLLYVRGGEQVMGSLVEADAALCRENGVLCGPGRSEFYPPASRAPVQNTGGGHRGHGRGRAGAGLLKLIADAQARFAAFHLDAWIGVQ
jgi:hypothetical protein